MMRLLAMGGYGGFVWAAYGLSGIALMGVLALSLRDYSRALAQWRLIEAKAN